MSNAGVTSIIPEGEGKTLKIWECKIGGNIGPIPAGSDLPMRDAVEHAFFQIAGQYSDFKFTGWGGTLSPGEKHILYKSPMPTSMDYIREEAEKLVVMARSMGVVLTIETVNKPPFAMRHYDMVVGVRAAR